MLTHISTWKLHMYRISEPNINGVDSVRHVHVPFLRTTAKLHSDQGGSCKHKKHIIHARLYDDINTAVQAPSL